MTPSRRNGFTLIELLIVVVVIGILASIAIPKFNFTQRRAFRSSMLSDLKNLANAQEMYHANHFRYSSDLAALKATPSEGVTLTVTEADGNGWAATATHAGISTGQCGIYYGDATASNGAPADVPGMVACDDFGS